MHTGSCLAHHPLPPSVFRVTPRLCHPRLPASALGQPPSSSTQPRPERPSVAARRIASNRALSWTTSHAVCLTLVEFSLRQAPCQTIQPPWATQLAVSRQPTSETRAQVVSRPPLVHYPEHVQHLKAPWLASARDSSLPPRGLDMYTRSPSSP